MAKAKAEEIFAFALYRVHLIEETLRDINLKRFPSDNPRVYADLIKSICNYIKSYLLSLNREDEAFDSEQMEDRLKIISLYTTNLAADLADINDAGGDLTSWELIHPFEEFSKKLYSDILIILKPFWEFNFAIRNRLIDHKEQLKAILNEDSFAQLFKQFPTHITDIYIISYPAFEKTNILLQGNLGHELGHPLALQYYNKEIQNESFLTEIKPNVKIIVTKWIEEIEKFEKITIDEIGREKYESDVLSDILKIRWYGLNELISDIISVRLFGVASILSTYEYASTIRKLDEISETSFYPPWRMRLRVMLEELLPDQQLSTMLNLIRKKKRREAKLYEEIYSSLKTKIDELKELTEKTTDSDFIKKNEKYDIAYKSINKTLPIVREFLNEVWPKNIKPIENDMENILSLYERINYNLPPNATEKDPFNPNPADIRQIINAGWFYKITKLAYRPNTEEENSEYLRRIDLLNRLIFKALELADIYTRYKERSV